MAHTEVDFTYQEAIRTLGVTPEKLDRLIDEGALPVNTTGAQTLIPRESILRYLATVTSVGKEKKKAAPPAKAAAAPKEALPPKSEASAPAVGVPAATPAAEARAAEASAASVEGALVADSLAEPEASAPVLQDTLPGEEAKD